MEIVQGLPYPMCTFSRFRKPAVIILPGRCTSYHWCFKESRQVVYDKAVKYLLPWAYGKWSPIYGLPPHCITRPARIRESINAYGLMTNWTDVCKCLWTEKKKHLYVLLGRGCVILLLKVRHPGNNFWWSLEQQCSFLVHTNFGQKRDFFVREKKCLTNDVSERNPSKGSIMDSYCI